MSEGFAIALAVLAWAAFAAAVFTYVRCAERLTKLIDAHQPGVWAPLPPRWWRGASTYAPSTARRLLRVVIGTWSIRIDDPGTREALSRIRWAALGCLVLWILALLSIARFQPPTLPWR
ncbi:MAG TPA: hypothetical protein VGG48_08845 [Rhizomicrobium sp.]|jgi:hypothetical protein